MYISIEQSEKQMNVLKSKIAWIPVLLIAVYFTQGCQNSKAPEQKLYQEVMNVHDSVMPKMKDIREGIKFAESTLEKEGLNEAKKSELTRLKRSLVQAEDAMWDWMHNFDAERAQTDTAEAYLRDEKLKIKNVRALMLGSIEEIEAFRKQLNEKIEDETN